MASSLKMTPTESRPYPGLPPGLYETHDQDGRLLTHKLAAFVSSLPGDDPKWSNERNIAQLERSGFTKPQRDLNVREAYKLTGINGKTTDGTGANAMASDDLDVQFAFCDSSLKRMPAMKVQMYGVEHKGGFQCQRCATGGVLGQPVFCECVTGGPKVFQGECANCRFSQYKFCSFRQPLEGNLAVPSSEARLSSTRILDKADPKPQSIITGATQSASNKDSRSGSFTCPFLPCSRLFNRSDNLKSHVTRKHPRYADRPFLCAELNCQERFESVGDLRKHSAVGAHHFANPPEDDDAAEMDMGPQHHRQAPIMKPKKNKQSSSNHAFVGSLSCPYRHCGATFSRSDNLKTHVKSKHPEYFSKPFQCSQNCCWKRFSTRGNMHKHVAHGHQNETAGSAIKDVYESEDGSDVNVSTTRINDTKGSVEYTPLLSVPRANMQFSYEPRSSIERPSGQGGQQEVVLAKRQRLDVSEHDTETVSARPQESRTAKEVKDQFVTVDFAFAKLKMELKESNSEHRDSVDGLDDELDKLKRLFRGLEKQLNS